MVEVGIVTAISFFSSLHLEQQEMKHAAFQSGSHHYCTFSPSQTQSPQPRNKSALKYDREHKVCIKVEGGVGLSCYNCKINVDSVELLLVVTTKAMSKEWMTMKKMTMPKKIKMMMAKKMTMTMAMKMTMLTIKTVGGGERSRGLDRSLALLHQLGKLCG